MKRGKPRILVVNDDGVHGAGLGPLVESLEKTADVTVLVPEKERSAQGHTLTLHKPLRLRKVRDRFYKVNGSPADCARLGVIHLMKGRADLIASGINAGYNLAQDVVYSGTVAAALEGAILKTPSFAISLGCGGADFHDAAVFAQKLAALILRHKLPPGVCLNVNVPPLPRGSVGAPAITRLGERLYDDRVTARKDPLGRSYYWLVGGVRRSFPRSGTDVAAVQKGRIAITPLHADFTHQASLPRLRGWGF